jgi:hypothetical protein
VPVGTAVSRVLDRTADDSPEHFATIRAEGFCQPIKRELLSH